MSTRNTGYAGTLLVLFAFLAGGAALWTVAGQASEQDEVTPAAVETTTQEDSVKPAEETSEMDGPRVEDILTTLASGAAIPPELQDPAFDYYVDLRLLGDAWVRLDSGLMTDLALQFAEGERVLLRSHRAIEASDLMEIAIRTAAVKSDTGTLDRLSKAIDRLENQPLAAELERARSTLADKEGESAWMLPVATTSAREFSRYKGILQDVEAAIVVRDAETLQELQEELKATSDLPAAHRQKLEAKVTRALEHLEGKETNVSEAAQVLDKLAYATRRGPAGGLPSVGRSPGMSALGSVGRWLSLANRSGGLNQLGPGSAYLGGGTPQVTHTPQSPTQCNAVTTQCPTQTTSCPRQVTRCPSVTSICPQGGGCTTPTQRPQSPTQCNAVSTSCPEGSVPTYCPAVLTRCPPRATQCSAWQTACPADNCQAPTQRPDAPTQCSPYPCQTPTQRPNSPTQCAPHLCDTPTQRHISPTQCSPAQGKCDRPTLYPEVPTSCPAVQTRCPYSETYCPPVCGQQQQQKQRWIPPRKGKYGSGGYAPGYPGGQQYGSPNDMVTPYPRRYDSSLR